MNRIRLAARDRTLLFGLAVGLVLGVAIGRKIYSPIVVMFLMAVVFACGYGALRLTRRARDAASTHMDPMDEDVGGA